MSDKSLKQKVLATVVGVASIAVTAVVGIAAIKSHK
jgi:hypothetical protein